jgi:membrane protein
MNLPIASILVLFYTLVAWVCVWNIIVNRRADADEPALHTHLIGIILGAVAAFGIFLIGATTALPTKDHELSSSMNILGRFILLIYICVLGRYRKQGISTVLKRSVRSMHLGDSSRGSQPLPIPIDRQHQHNLMSTLEKRLGMSTERFFDERIGDHVRLWIIMLALGTWAYALHAMSHIRDNELTILPALLSLVVIGILFVIVIFTPPLRYVAAIIITPLAFLSVQVETWLRVCLNRPYDPKP